MNRRDPALAETAHAGLELDPEYEHTPVPTESRKSLLTVSAVWFGFPMILTNAVPGGIVVALMGFWRGLAAIVAANLVMLVYVGLLSHRAGSTGESFSLQATKTFGRVGYVVASGFLATVVVGWFAFNTGATGATLHQAFGWHEQLVAAVAGVAFVAITFLGIRALSWLGAVAAPLFILVGLIALVIVSRDHDLATVLDYKGVGGNSALTFGAAVSLIMATFADSGT
ncbi:cytosine permease, partial [Streptomyces sp. NPDC056728]